MGEKEQKIIWDYDVKTLNLKDEKTMRWYLVRTIEFGDWASISPNHEKSSSSFSA